LENRNTDQTDPESVQDSLKFITPKGKVVYGGGGIIPDIYSPNDPIFNSTLFEFLKGTGVLDFFVFEQLDKHRGRYSSVPESQFLKEFEITDVIYQQFISYLRAFTDVEVTKAMSFEAPLKVLLKSAFTKQLFGDIAAAKVLLEIDPILNKVIELESLGALD
jgi:carboxyl-terminal processing protease